MGLPRPGCTGWLAGMLALVLALVLTVAGGAVAQDASPGRPEAIAVAHILVAPLHDGIASAVITDETAWESARVQAEDLVAFVATQPADVFALVASQSSDDLVTAFEGGHLGRITATGAADSIPAPVVDAVRALADPDPGTILGPIRSPLGWHVVRIEDPADTPVAWPASRGFEPPVILLDAGAEPRTVLRFAPAAGATAAISVSASIGTTRSSDTGATLELGGATLSGTFTVTAAPHPDGTQLDLVLDQITVLGLVGADDAATREATEPLTGMQASMVVAPNGLPLSTSIELPDGLDPVLAEALLRSVDGIADAVGTYPDEPVGSGARWTTVRQIPGPDGEDGAVISTRTVLSPIDGTRLQLATATARSDGPDMEHMTGAGVSMRLAGIEHSVATRVVEPGSLSLTTTDRANGIEWLAPLGSADNVTRTIVARVDLQAQPVGD